MVGFFVPLLQIFKERKAVLEIIDMSRGFGPKEDYYARLENRAEVLF